MQYFSFTPSDFTSITSHIHNCVLFLLWLHPFILSGVISPLISSSILGTYRPGEIIFQCPIFLPFHPVHGVLKERILKCLASSGWSIDLNYCDAECFTLEMNQDHSVIFEIAPKYYISASFVGCNGYSISSKEFLPTCMLGCLHGKSLKPCLTLCNPMDYSLPSSSVHGIFPGKNTEVV